MKLYVLLSATLSLLCHHGAKCCENASFNNTEFSLHGKDYIVANITGCLTGNKETENVTMVYFAGGFVPTLYKDAVSNMLLLTEINFIDMKLRRIERGSFVNLPALRTLALGLNFLSEISEYMFTDLPLRHLFLNYNGIYFIEDKAFAIDSLEYLNLCYNKIETFSPDWFHESNLEVLILSKNLLTYIPENAFVNLRKLKVISFQMNRITSVHKDTFKILPDIKLIDLACNRIKNVDPDLFRFTSGGENFANLYLSCNLLTYLPKRMLDHLNNLKDFHFHDNPWQCSCYSLIKNWTESKNISIDHIVIDLSIEVPKCMFLSDPDVCLESVDEELIEQYLSYQNPNCKIIINCYTHNFSG